MDTPLKGDILIVDDTLANLRLLSGMLAERGYKVRSAINGQMALRAVHAATPDLILLDINMPEMNGYEVCGRLKDDAATRDIPIIFISALDEIQNKVQAFTAGGVDYITKPFQFEEVLARVQTHLALRSLQQQLQRHNEVLEERVAERTRTLAKERNLLRTLIDNLPDYVYVKDTASRFLTANNTMTRFLGAASLDEIIGKTDADFFTTEEIDRFSQSERRVIAAGQPLINQEELITAAQTGAPMWLSATRVPFRDSEGNIAGIVGMIRDITAVKQAEQERLRLAALDRELTLAREIQQSLLPPPSPAWQDVEVVCYNAPMHEVGGDLYSYHDLPRNTQNPHGGYAIAVGDVTGKGIPAALYMAVSTTLLSAKIAFVPDLAQLMAEMNTALYQYMYANHMNIAISCVRLEPVNNSQGSYAAQFVNAGLIAPILRRGADCQYLELGGLPLGTVATSLPYKTIQLPLCTGDVIVLSSDGIVEAHNAAGEMYGFDRLVARVAAAPDSALGMIEWIMTDVRAFMGDSEPHDDMTLAVVRV